MPVSVMRGTEDGTFMVALEQNGPLRNLLLRVAYDGTDFYGWQIQPQRPTIQGLLVSALGKVCGEPIEVCGAGRTDAGVHACGQAANVKLSSPIPCSNLVKAANHLLPESIRILSSQEAPENFHARHHAQSKTYRYRIFRGAICPPWRCRYVFPYPYRLDESAIERAAKYFQGTLDFRAFAAADGDRDEQTEDVPETTEMLTGNQHLPSQAPFEVRSRSRYEKSCVRTIFSSEAIREGDELVYTVQGNGFLRHMVRNIVGTLIETGRGRLAPERIPEILALGSRSAAGPTAPARGLQLISVYYPPEVLRIAE